jgi:hypothetical protein
MSSTAHLEVVVGSGGVMSADKALKQLTATAKETEKQQQHMAAVMAEIAAAEERAAAKAVAASTKQADAAARAAARESEAWNDAKQKALARYDQQAAAAERAAERQLQATARTISRENEMWDRAIQRAKAGLDGVLPIRPSLQRIEANQQQSSGIGAGIAQGALGSVGMGVLAGGAAGIAAAGVEKLFSTIAEGKNAVIDVSVELNNLRSRIAGVTGSADTANDKFEELESMTLGKLPSTVRQVSEAFVFLGNTGLSNSREALKSYSNIAAQTGHSLNDVTEAVERATLGNYRGLRQYGIKVKEEGDNLQVTFRGQTDTIAHSSEAIEGYMQRLGNVEFAGAVDRQMDTIGGSVKKAHDAWEKLIVTVADSSLGSLIQSTVGASVSVVDAMTASVDALFDRVHKGARELEADKARIAAQDKLDKTMMGWADPSASKSEINALAARLEAHAQSSADKALEQYTKNEALIDRLAALGETRVGDMTLEEARTENERQYRRDNGSGKPKQAYDAHVVEGQQTGEAAYTQMVAKQEYDQFLIVRDALAKQEDAERASYEKRREFLAEYTGPDSEALWAKNTDLWEKHLDDVAEKAAKKQIELQQKLQRIGIGPQSQIQQVNNKTAGYRLELEGALAENLSGKNGDVLKLEAERTYAEKSIAIEKARAKEIEAINRELAQQSMQNAELIFGGLATAMKNAHGEQSKEYRAMFAMQKAFALATAEVALYTDMAKASEAGFPANIPLYLKAAADGAQIISALSSMSYSGAYDAGGRVPGGSYGDVGERGWELVRGGKVAGPAQVVGREATAAMLGGGGARPIRIVNAFDGGEAVRGFLGSTAGEQVLVNFVKRNGSLIRTVSR